jgi:hypothetical protein
MLSSLNDGVISAFHFKLAKSSSSLGIKLNDLREALANQAMAIYLCVDNTEFLVDERSRARLDVSQVEIENGIVRR